MRWKPTTISEREDKEIKLQIEFVHKYVESIKSDNPLPLRIYANFSQWEKEMVDNLLREKRGGSND